MPEKEMSRARTLLKLFLTNLYISAFTFGGGFVIVTFMKKKYVDELHWIDEQEMLDLTALAQSSPGAIAVNVSILIGWRVGGFWGMVTSVVATCIPPVAIISIISFFYKAFAANRYVSLVLKGMQAGVAAVILDVVVGLGYKVLAAKDWVHILVMVTAFILVFFLDVNVMWIILAAAVVGIILTCVRTKKEVKA